MKKISFLFAFIAFSLTSCSSDEPGPQGPPGEPGVNIVGQTFEFEDVDFEYFEDGNFYATIIDIPAEIEVLESDAVLVYRREVIDGTETWSMIPQNYFLEEGIIQYVFNHTASDIELLIDGNFDLSTLDGAYSQNQFFRFFVVPSDFAIDTGVDVSDYDAVMQALK
ncbi:collagen-like protein [Salinimicrobium sediminilitoris]|uniref:collagen-like protein n=1 Tax=Salinimicrobium sediminilitoris TaxID=2876715 RepID=UPI001E2E7F72|nr:collagen-like protein [Salinimicrobium sediminilitoris]MCC8359117.1 collagen-like protein [Salinimicrobium sediminilitoris]